MQDAKQVRLDAEESKELSQDELAEVSAAGSDDTTMDTVRKAGGGTTSGGVYLRYTFGTVFTTKP